MTLIDNAYEYVEKSNYCIKYVLLALLEQLQLAADKEKLSFTSNKHSNLDNFMEARVRDTQHSIGYCLNRYEADPALKEYHHSLLRWTITLPIKVIHLIWQIDHDALKISNVAINVSLGSDIVIVKELDFSIPFVFTQHPEEIKKSIHISEDTDLEKFVLYP